MIAPSKLGELVSLHTDGELLLRLRQLRLVRGDVSDEDLKGTFERAREEHAALPLGQQKFNSPEERVRVFLEPFLTAKGARWAVPLVSFKPWWKFWR